MMQQADLDFKHGKVEAGAHAAAGAKGDEGPYPASLLAQPPVITTAHSGAAKQDGDSHTRLVAAFAWSTQRQHIPEAEAEFALFAMLSSVPRGQVYQIGMPVLTLPHAHVMCMTPVDTLVPKLCVYQFLSKLVEKVAAEQRLFTSDSIAV